MKHKTYLPGKDISLEDTVEKATTLLAAMDLPAEAVSWLNPAPNCWSVHIQATGCPQLYTNGKGTSRLASLASGLGEFFERLSTNLLFTDYYLGEMQSSTPFHFFPDETWFSPGPGDTVPTSNKFGIELLNPILRSFYDPEGELRASHLCDNNTDDAGRGISALPFQSLDNSRTTFFPVSLLNNLYVSNGMAAGNSPAECCSQALSEIIERYVKNQIIAKGISLPDVPASHLQKYPRLCSILDVLTKQRLEVRVKDASLGGRFPVISVLVADPDDGGVYAAFGANFRFETAVERTLTELLQGRRLDQLRGFQPPCHDLDIVADPFNLESHFVDSDGLLSWNMFKDKPAFTFSPWDFAGSTESEFSRLHLLIGGLGFAIYRAEYLHCGMYSCRMLVPGMSEIYPIDDLIWNNKGTGALLRPHLLRLPQMSEDELTRVFELLETIDPGDQQLVSHIIGVLFDAHSSWSTLRIGELKALILLALNKKDAALDWCGWCQEYGGLPEKRKRLYRLLHTLLCLHGTGSKLDDFTTGLRLFYREKELREATSIINGEVKFPGLAFGRTWMEISSEHARLLEIYQRVNRIKMTGVSLASD